MADAKQTAATTKVKLIKNIKYGNTLYKIGDTLEVNPEDLDEFKKARVFQPQ